MLKAKVNRSAINIHSYKSVIVLVSAELLITKGGSLIIIKIKLTFYGHVTSGGGLTGGHSLSPSTSSLAPNGRKPPVFFSPLLLSML